MHELSNIVVVVQIKKTEAAPCGRVSVRVVQNDSESPATGDDAVPGPTVVMTANKQDNSQPSVDHSEPPSAESTQPDSSLEHESTSRTTMSDRSELLDRARHFLSSPQVVHQDLESKRHFLKEKGLADGDIQLLLREVVRLVLFPSARPLKARIARKAFATPCCAATDVSRTATIPLARSSRGYLQGAFMANRKLHPDTLHLLRTDRPPLTTFGIANGTR